MLIQEPSLPAISESLLFVPTHKIDQAIDKSLYEIMTALGLDRSSVLVLKDGESIEVHSVALRDAVTPSLYDLKKQFPWLYSKLLETGIFSFSSIAELPPEAKTDVESFAYCKIKSNLCIMFRPPSQPNYVMFVATQEQEKIWVPELVNTLKAVAIPLVGALVRKSAATESRSTLSSVEQPKPVKTWNARSDITASNFINDIIGQSDAIKELRSHIVPVATTNSTVLILGETGTGKELLARAIHAHSSRCKSTMVKVNCAALPPALVESELFGHEKGAYTGALAKSVGRFELADNSTLFLDEVGELPLDAQAKLLRVLQEGQFERVGSPKTICVNVRIIAATNRDLEAAVKEGRFRQDLYYRLNVYPIRVPPLRERRADIPQLVWAFVKEFGETMGKAVDSIPNATLEMLSQQAWPGNIRELRNVIERAMILCQDSTLNIQLSPATPNTTEVAETDLASIQRRHILQVLQSTRWRVSGKKGAAKLLGLKATTLEARMAKLGIVRPACNGCGRPKRQTAVASARGKLEQESGVEST